MKGVYKVEVGTKKLKYVLTLKRNITIIRGDTATGKTTLIKFLISASDFDDSSGIKVKCEKECIVLSGKKWETDLSSIHDSIVFIDEHNGFIESKDFAKAVANSDNYYVLFTRANLPNLPYSIEEIYEFKSTGRLEKGESVYNSMHRLRIKEGNRC